MSEKAFMRRAAALALEKMRANSGGPFGAVIVRNDTIIAEGWNEVTSSNDPTAHAEIVAIRRACKRGALLGGHTMIAQPLYNRLQTTWYGFGVIGGGLRLANTVGAPGVPVTRSTLLFAPLRLPVRTQRAPCQQRRAQRPRGRP